jgi:hypothetical protein
MKLQAKSRLTSAEWRPLRNKTKPKPERRDEWYVSNDGDYAGYGNGPDAEKKARAAAKKDGGTVKFGKVPS